jgi:predicted DNA-binding ribbon-helix-helix protein
MPVKAVDRGERSGVFRMSGRTTNITLEDEFWNALHEIAVTKGTARPSLIREIDKTRSSANLASAVRLFVLAYYQGSGR